MGSSFPAAANQTVLDPAGDPVAVPWPRPSTPGVKRRGHLRLLNTRRMTDGELLAEFEAIAAAEERKRFDWLRHARPEQLEPPAGYRMWLIMSGRGWGKTRTGAETIRKWAMQQRGGHYAVVAKTHREVQAICFEAQRAGLLAVIPPEEVTQYKKSPVMLILKNGSVIRAFSAEDPDVFRGYAFDAAWFDEYAAWPKKTAQAVMDMMWFCLREAANPRIVITTTPKALPHVKALVTRSKADNAVVVTAGHTMDNRANLSEVALAELDASYAGTRLGRQELAGELLEDVEGALWTPGMFEWDGFRVPLDEIPVLEKRVLAVDPAVTSSDNSDRYGISVGGVWVDRAGSLPGMQGKRHVYGLHTEAWRATPQAAMKRIAKTFRDWDCDYVIFETNNGGDYLPALLEVADPLIPCKKVVARKGKILRAEPVSQLYEQQRARHVGPPSKWAALESVMTTFTGDPSEESPDDLDAHVYMAMALAGPLVKDGSASSVANLSKTSVPGGSGIAALQIHRSVPTPHYG